VTALEKFKTLKLQYDSHDELLIYFGFSENGMPNEVINQVISGIHDHGGHD
jgi:hypothetical protein